MSADEDESPPDMTTSHSPAASASPGAPLISALRLPDEERVTSGGSSRMTKFVVWTVLFVMLGGIVVLYRRNPTWLQELRGAEYETVVVATKETENVAIEASGFVVPYRQVRVSPRIPGAILQLNFDVGQKVKKGDLLAQLDDTNYLADIAQAEAALQAARSRQEEAMNGALPEEVNQARTALDVAKSKLELVTNELEREEQLGDSTTQAQLDQLVSAKKDAEAQVASLTDKLKLIEQGPRPERMKAIEADVKQAEALVTKARYLLDNTKIIAPLDGTVLEKNAEVGEIVRPEVLSVSLCSLADMSIMEVEVDVQERELHKVAIGRPCTVIPDAYPSRKYVAKIDRIQPQVIRARGVVRVTIRIEQPDDYLLPEMNVRAIIDNPETTEVQVDTLWAPEGAVTTVGDQSHVFLLVDGKAVQTPVTVGAKEGRKVELTSGVKAGDALILAGGKRLMNGQPVRLAEKK